MSDFTKKNQDHFDKQALNQEDDFKALIQQSIDEVQKRRAWISPILAAPAEGKKEHIKVLDYACGAGTMSKALIPYVTQILGLDLSSKMVAQYNSAAQSLGLGPERMHARQYNLLDEAASDPLGPEYTDFDIIITSMALHHVADPARLLKLLTQRLKPDGVCVVLDQAPRSFVVEQLERLPEKYREAMKTVRKHGFTEAEMKELYEGAGMGRNFEHVVVEEPFHFLLAGQEFEVRGFIAKGQLD